MPPSHGGQVRVRLRRSCSPPAPRALLDGRLAPSPEDVLAMARPVLIHRMALSFAARARGDDLGAIIAQVAQAAIAERSAA